MFKVPYLLLLLPFSLIESLLPPMSLPLLASLLLLYLVGSVMEDVSSSDLPWAWFLLVALSCCSRLLLESLLGVFLEEILITSAI